MKIWTNTKTLDDYIKPFLVDKKDAEFAVVGSKNLNLNELPKLKGIFRVGVGTNNLPFAEANEREISIRLPSPTTSSYIYKETANFTCYLILKMLYNRVGSVKEWNKESREFLGDRKVLIVGTGNIGKLVSSKMSNFVFVDEYDSAVHCEDDLKEKITNADCISLHIPMDESNCRFFDKEKLSWMKDGSSLVNTSRGGVVSENDLHTEVKSGRISAAFDVFWEEPYRGVLAECSGFHITPHIASTNEKFLEGSYKDLINFVREFDD